ncbi:MAG: alpha-amylase [Mogibacterium sp.]|nr:alpha-amylase [Mogibacterium sp.]MBR2540339.1 alpha-amylase [Mogibacterium sp.]
MSWYNEAVFYHIYPLGLTGAPALNDYGEPVHRLRTIYPWIDHIKDIGCNALYIGPLFQSVGHGYETTDYRSLDSRLGTNDDLAELVRICHEKGIRVILDGVFNHTGRDFFAFRDIQANRENSRYRDWYCNVNFWGNNEYNDGFSYDNWGGYNLLAKLNQRNPEVRDYLLDTVRFWVSEFDIDGIRLDAADVLDFDFMKALRDLADHIKEDFWLMGEVIHGDYSRWANSRTLHSVTDYQLHKALYSAHNDHNYFEIAHTVRRHEELGLRDIRLYNFADNHDVERIYTRLRNKAHFMPLHILLYSLPGIPSIYYGSEFGIEGRKERGSDASLRPELHLEQMQDNVCSELIRALGRIHLEEKALVYGDYQELQLTTTQYAFSRGDVIISVNNSDAEAGFDVPGSGTYHGALYCGEAVSDGGRVRFTIPGCSGEIWIPEGREWKYEPISAAPMPVEEEPAEAAYTEPKRAADPGKPYEEMSIEELQAEILAKMAANGPVTDRMKQDVIENVYRDSLLNWVKSFR